MFLETFSLIIRSILSVFTASSVIHVCRSRLVSWMSWNSTHPWHQPAATGVNNIRSCKYRWNAPDDKWKYR